MAMTLARSRVEQPEFELVPDTYIQAYLDEATTELDPEIWGTKFDQGVKYRAAHKMALSPQGVAMKLVTGKGESTYGHHFLELASVVASGFRVAIWPAP